MTTIYFPFAAEQSPVIVRRVFVVVVLIMKNIINIVPEVSSHPVRNQSFKWSKYINIFIL